MRVQQGQDCRTVQAEWLLQAFEDAPSDRNCRTLQADPLFGDPGLIRKAILPVRFYNFRRFKTPQDPKTALLLVLFYSRDGS